MIYLIDPKSPDLSVCIILSICKPIYTPLYGIPACRLFDYQ